MSRALADRGLSIAQFQQDLRVLVKAWGTAGKLGVEFGCSAASIDNQMKGYQPPTAPMAERLYGPGRGNRLIVRGPDARPVERKWVQDEPVLAGPEGETPLDPPVDPDDVDAGVARILAACGKRAAPAPEPERETDPEFLDHQLAERAEVPAEVAQLAECDASNVEGAGSTPALRSISPDDEAEAAIEAAGAALREGRLSPHPMEHPVTSLRPARPSLEVMLATVGPATEEDLQAQRESWKRGEMGIGSDADEARERAALRAKADGSAGPRIPSAADEIRPWSKLEDSDFVAMTRGKLAGLEAELAELDAARQALLADVAKVQAQSLEAEQKAAALRRTIEIFETPMEEVVA